MVRQLIIAAALGTLLSTAAVAVSGDAEDTAACEEGTVYGTVMVIDEGQGLFSLVGTGLELVVSPDIDLAELEGRAVRIEIDEMCGVLEIEVLDNASEAIT